MTIRNTIGLAGAVLWGFSASAAFAQAGAPTTVPGSKPALRKLTLKSAVETALTNSTGLKTAVEQVNKARGTLNESRSAFLPTLSAQGTATHLNTGVTAELGGGQSISIVKQDQKAATITAAVPLDIAGMLNAAVSLSEFQYLIARLDYNRLRNQLVQDVTTGYYGVLRAKAYVDVATQALKNAEDRAQTAQAFYNAKTGTRYDVLRAQADVANARQSLISAQNGVDLAMASLNNVLGLDQNTPLELEPLAVVANPIAPPMLDEVLTEAYRVRPEVLQAETGIKAAQKGYYLASRSQAPSVALSWTQQYTPDAGSLSRKNSWAAVATVTLPIFDAGVGAARRQQAQAGLDAARIGRQQAMDGVALDVRQAHLSLVEANERLKVADAALAQAEEAYRLANVRYQAGVSTLLEMSDAQTALTQAQTNRINAQYDVETARTKLERAVGRYAYSEDAQPGLPRPLGGSSK